MKIDCSNLGTRDACVKYGSRPNDPGGAFYVLFLLLVFFVPPVAGQDRPAERDRPTVKKVRIEGLEQFRLERIRSRMKTRAGRPFREKTLEKDIQRLVEKGFIQDATWSKETTDEGVVITLRVSENPKIDRVVLRGVEEFSKGQLKKDLTLPGSDTLNSYKLSQDKSFLREKYRKEGFHFVQVMDRKMEGKRGIILVLEVVEGPQVSVEKIRVRGADKIPQWELVDEMKSAPGNWLFGSTLYQESVLKKDLQRVRGHYRKQGYLDASVFLEDVQFVENKHSAIITLRVNEGERYSIQEILFNGNTLFTREELLEEIVLQPGKPFLLKEMRNDQQAIKNLYGKQAYIDTEVNWTQQIIGDTNNVRLIFQITEHGKTQAGRINIRGNTKTKDKVIRRNISVIPGKPINLIELRQSLQRLRSTRFFSSVSVQREPSEREPGTEHLTFKVKERSTGRIQFGGGFSSDAGVVGIFRISQDNFDLYDTPDSFSDIITGEAFSGGGQKLNLTARPGNERSEFSIQFREPYLYDQPLGLDVQASIRDRIFEDFNENRGLLRTGLDYRKDDWTYSLGLEAEDIEISDVESGSPTDLRDIEGNHRLYSVTPGLKLDKRNNLLRPSSGYLFESSYRNTLGDFEFGKWNADLRKFFSLYSTPRGGTHILTLRGRVGLATSYVEDKEIPSFDRFFAGGSSTIRGFEFRTISPRVNDVEVGGNARWITNVEYTFPIIRTRQRGRRKDILRGAVFVDSGSVTESTGDFGEKIRVSSGVGIRFQIPGFGQVPFALDFGFPIVEEEGDDQQVISFNLGASF